MVANVDLRQVGRAVRGCGQRSHGDGIGGPVLPVPNGIRIVTRIWARVCGDDERDRSPGKVSLGVVMGKSPEMVSCFMVLSAFAAWLLGFRSG
jgi:hypothetical protein